MDKNQLQMIKRLIKKSSETLIDDIEKLDVSDVVKTIQKSNYQKNPDQFRYTEAYVKAKDKDDFVKRLSVLKVKRSTATRAFYKYRSLFGKIEHKTEPRPKLKPVPVQSMATANEVLTQKLNLAIANKNNETNLTYDKIMKLADLRKHYGNKMSRTLLNRYGFYNFEIDRLVELKKIELDGDD